jgi:hypothetical protein
MRTSFEEYVRRRDESFGGSAGDPSNAGLDQPENGEREVTVDPNASLGGEDKPITSKNRKKSIVGQMGGMVYSKKKCNCK